MLCFRVPYTLEYYCSKPFRLSFAEKVKRITIIDSYATSSVTMDYEDLDTAIEFSIQKADRQLKVFSISLKGGAILFFVDDKSLVADLIKMRSYVGISSDVPDENKYYSCFKRILQKKSADENAYIICASKSNFEARKKRIQEICTR